MAVAHKQSSMTVDKPHPCGSPLRGSFAVSFCSRQNDHDIIASMHVSPRGVVRSIVELWLTFSGTA